MDKPTEKDINIYNSLDEKTATEHFLNKTREEAELLFRENSSFYQEDLMWMGPHAFNYYLESVIDYLKSEYAAGDDYFISCLYEIIKFRLEEKKSQLAVEVLIKMMDYILENYSRFNIDETIYGNLLLKYKQLRQDLESNS